MSLMMSIHPNDETLSRLADLSQVELMRSRAGRHVARCEDCAAVIAELRALGSRAREIPDREPPQSLWTRIEEERARVGKSGYSGEGATTVLSDAPGNTRGNPRDGGHRWGMGAGRAAVVFAAAAAVLATVLLWPSHAVRELGAAGVERLVLTPRYPAPGGAILVRYVPGVALRTDTLWLQADAALTGPAASKARLSSPAYTAVPLARTPAGDYSGTLILSKQALAAVVAVVDSSGRPAIPRSSLRELVLTSSASQDRPTLDAMERASELRLGVARQQLVEAFTRWAPDHPLRWALSDDVRPASGVLSWVRRFARAERAFSRLDGSLRARPRHRVFELIGMIELAYALEEPAAARRWTDVLVAEHPDDPRALAARATALHQMELDGLPRDSIEPLLPSLDTLYKRSGGLLGDAAISALVHRYGDTSAARQWRLREIRSRVSFGNARDSLLQDAAFRDSAEAYAHEVLASTPKPVLRTDGFERMRAFTTLAAVAYWRGDPRGALAWSDSARALGGSCTRPAPYVRAAALLALGDTLRAEDALADRWLWPASTTDARTLLGSRFDAQRWQNKLAAAEQHYRSCRASEK